MFFWLVLGDKKNWGKNDNWTDLAINFGGILCYFWGQIKISKILHLGMFLNKLGNFFLEIISAQNHPETLKMVFESFFRSWRCSLSIHCDKLKLWFLKTFLDKNCRDNHQVTCAEYVLSNFWFVPKIDFPDGKRKGTTCSNIILYCLWWKVEKFK